MYIIQIMVAGAIKAATRKGIGNVGTVGRGASGGSRLAKGGAGAGASGGSRLAKGGAGAGAGGSSKLAKGGAGSATAGGAKKMPVIKKGTLLKAAAAGTGVAYLAGRGGNDEKIEECTKDCKPGGYDDWVTDNTKSLTFSETEGDSDQPHCTEAIFEEKQGDCDKYCTEKCEDAHGGFLNTVMDGVDRADVADVGIADAVNDVVDEGADIAGDIVDEGVDIAGDVIDEGLDLGGDLLGDVFGGIFGSIWTYVVIFVVLVVLYFLWSWSRGR